MRSTVLLVLCSLVGVSQCTIYWFTGQEQPLPKTTAVQVVYNQLDAIRAANTQMDDEKLNLLIEQGSQYIDLDAEEFDSLSYVVECFWLPDGSIKGKAVSVGWNSVAYDIVLEKKQESPTGYMVTFLMGKTRQ